MSWIIKDPARHDNPCFVFSSIGPIFMSNLECRLLVIHLKVDPVKYVDPVVSSYLTPPGDCLVAEC